MHDDLRHVGLMHPAQHFRKIGDRTSLQQALHGQQHDVGFGLASLALVRQCVAEEIFIPDAGFRLEGSILAYVPSAASLILLIPQFDERVLVFSPRLPHFHPQLQKHLHAESRSISTPCIGPDCLQPLPVFPNHDGFM